MGLQQEALSENFTLEFFQALPNTKQKQMDDNGKCIPKDKKDISEDSVQNTFDETVIYRYKREQHHGHVLNVAEACDNEGNGIIIHAVVKSNTQSYSRMAEKYVDQLPGDGQNRRLIMDMDGAYNSDRLETIVETKDVELQTTSLMRKASEDIVADFNLNEEETEILSCSVVKVIEGFNKFCVYAMIISWFAHQNLHINEANS